MHEAYKDRLRADLKTFLDEQFKPLQAHLRQYRNRRTQQLVNDLRKLTEASADKLLREYDEYVQSADRIKSGALKFKKMLQAKKNLEASIAEQRNACMHGIAQIRTLMTL